MGALLARVGVGALLAAAGVAAPAALLIPPAAVAAPAAHLRVAAPVREQEPLARVVVRARLTDADGRGVADARCRFTWRQGGAVLHRSVLGTAASGRVSDARVVVHAVPGRAVRVTVRCRAGDEFLRASTWFVPQPPLPAVPRIVFVGDSLTRGLYASSEAAGFRALVAAAVPCTSAAVYSGNGRAGGVDLAQVAAAAGDIYVIGLGTNDASGAPSGVRARPETVAANLRAVVRAARSASPACRIVLLTIWQFRALRAVYDPGIVAVATAAGRHVVDLGPLKDDPALSGPARVETPWGLSDNWHPNDAGHAAIALRVSTLIERLLRRSGVEAGDIIGAPIRP